jgi:putative PIN family toxin of toxin-antitoxin system
MERKRRRVFLDSNVILSGLVSESGAPRLILDLLSLDLPVLSGITGRFNLIEIERNLGKKMPAALPVYDSYLPRLKLEVIPLPSGEDLHPLSGAAEEKDLPVLASAVNGRADYLVTGDKNLLSLAGRKGGLPFITVSPSEFLDKLLSEILAGKRRNPV